MLSPADDGLWSVPPTGAWRPAPEGGSMAARDSDARRETKERLADRARFIRMETVRLARIAGAGHYTSTFSAAELFAALYYAELRVDPTNPHWPERDRFVL